MKINAVYKISDSPLIWAGTGPKNWGALENNSKQKAYLLAHPMWEFSWTSLKLYFLLKRRLKKKNISMILLNNSAKENNFAKFFGFKSFLINQNIHCCEHQFKIDSSVKKLYNAVYTAAAANYKRLQLASKIKKLYVITYFWPDIKNEKGEWDLPAFEPKVKHADFNKFRIDQQEIKRILNQSKCGLALSKKEGAMWASMEYLLCGLPIISTQSKGGRDFFFTKNNSLIVKDDPESIRDAVDKIIARDINSNDIRDEALKLIEPYRQQYLQLIQRLHEENGIMAPAREKLYFKIWGNSEGLANIRII